MGKASSDVKQINDLKKPSPVVIDVRFTFPQLTIADQQGTPSPDQLLADLQQLTTIDSAITDSFEVEVQGADNS